MVICAVRVIFFKKFHLNQGGETLIGKSRECTLYLIQSKILQNSEKNCRQTAKLRKAKCGSSRFQRMKRRKEKDLSGEQGSYDSNMPLIRFVISRCLGITCAPETGLLFCGIPYRQRPFHK